MMDAEKKSELRLCCMQSNGMGHVYDGCRVMEWVTPVMYTE